MNGTSGNWNSGSAGPRRLNNNNPDNNWNNIGARGRCDAPRRKVYRSRMVTAAGADLTYQVVSPFVRLRQIHNRIGIAGSRFRNPRPQPMGKKFRHLLSRIVEPSNLREAYRRARRDKRMTFGHLEFKEHAETNLSKIGRDLDSGTYTVGPYKTFTIYEPKAREIMALPFYDRVVQHALCNVVEPIIDAVLMPMCAACRTGKGTHYGVIRAQSHMRRLERSGSVYCLKMDFSKYFANIDRRILIGEIRRKISCEATMAIIETITPPAGKGLPIGNLTSQLWANLYGHMFDRFLVHELGIRHATRYMDDTVIFGNDLDELQSMKARIDAFVADDMALRFSKWSIQPISRGVNFLGYRIWTTHRLLRRDSVRRAKRKLRRLRATGDKAALRRFVASWSGHASWADSHNLLTSLKLEANSNRHHIEPADVNVFTRAAGQFAVETAKSMVVPPLRDVSTERAAVENRSRPIKGKAQARATMAN